MGDFATDLTAFAAPLTTLFAALKTFLTKKEGIPV
jgi:hypothetical protein